MSMSMANLPISFACGLYDRMLPLYTRDVQPEGIDLNFIRIDDPRQIFDRMSGGLEFDASEMSSSEFISRKNAERHGGPPCPFVAIPVIASRVFRHGFVIVNRDRIKSPKDLAGKRIGVPLFTMSAAIWIRGHLMHDYGVDLSNVTWVQGAINYGKSHGEPSVPPLAKPATIVNSTGGVSLSDLLDRGEIDALIGTDLPKCMKTNPAIQRLWPNYREVEREYYQKTKIFPIMHVIVIRKSLYEKHPFIATSLFNAFCRAKEAALERMYYIGALRYMLPWLTADLDEIDELFDGDPWPYGVEPNRPTLEALVTYLADQGVTKTREPVDSLFVPTYGQHTPV
jgi:4,5-dihydroxyphthalate decarboxylase